MKLEQAFKESRWDVIQQKINRQFECEVSLMEVEKAFGKEEYNFGEGWSEGTWFMWIKNRMSFSYGHLTNQDNFKSNPLHFFFITIPEDMKMLGRLKSDSWEMPETTARSRISKTVGSIRPINRVAMLVSKPE